MSYLIVAGLILSLLVRYWPGQPAPQWIGTWIDRLWVLLGVTFLAGVVLSFVNMTHTVLPNGGIRYSTSRPQPIQYALIAIYVPLVVLALLGAGHVARSAARALSPSRAREVLSTATAGVHFAKLWASLAVALGAFVVGLAFGGPLTVSTSEGYSNVLPFAVEAITALVFFAALASAWSAARPSPERQ